MTHKIDSNITLHSSFFKDYITIDALQGSGSSENNLRSFGIILGLFLRLIRQATRVEDINGHVYVISKSALKKMIDFANTETSRVSLSTIPDDWNSASLADGFSIVPLNRYILDVKTQNIKNLLKTNPQSLNPSLWSKKQITALFPSYSLENVRTRFLESFAKQIAVNKRIMSSGDGSGGGYTGVYGETISTNNRRFIAEFKHERPYEPCLRVNRKTGDHFERSDYFEIDAKGPSEDKYQMMSDMQKKENIENLAQLTSAQIDAFKKHLTPDNIALIKEADARREELKANN